MCNDCYDCKYVGYDVDLYGYCNCPNSVYYKHIVINDNGCVINTKACSAIVEQ